MHWLFNNWYQLLVAPAAYMALLASALFCGILIGAEREKKIKPAGLRTMILIALGSALFTMLSEVMADGAGERSRIAAQIVSGIGFLGTGAILHDNFRVRGLTTAATIWIVAALGMLCGAGYGGAAISLTVVITVLLQGITWIENRYLGPCFYRQVSLMFNNERGKTAIKIDAILDDYRILPASIKTECRDNDVTEMTLHYCNAHKHHKDFLIQFAKMPEIISINRYD